MRGKSEGVCERPPEGWTCSREAGHEGPCAARPEGQTIAFTLSGNEAFGLLAVARWLKDGLHLLLNDGPTRRAVDKLYEAAEMAVHEKRDAPYLDSQEPQP